MATTDSPRRIRAALLCTVTALELAFGLVACRELTAPVQEESAGVLAQGLFIRSNGDPVSDAYINIRPERDENPSTLQVVIYTDAEGRFECWVPDVPLQISLQPSYRSDLPDLLERNVRFRSGEVRVFVLKGELYPGVLGPEKYTSLFGDVDVSLRHHIQSADGGMISQTLSTSTSEGGGFRIFLPEEGRYSADVYTFTGEFYLNYNWPDSIEVAEGDTVRLTVPLVSYQLELRMGGLPLPVQEFQCRAEFWDQYSASYMNFHANGQDVLFDSVGLGQATRIRFYSQASGADGDPLFLTSYLPITSLHDGDRLSYELGEYQLRIHVIDAEGNSLREARVYVYGENSLGNYTFKTTDSDGVADYRANPSGMLLQVTRTGYVEADRYFSLTGDMQMEIVLQSLPNEE